MKKIIKFLSTYGIYILLALSLVLGFFSLIFKNVTLDGDLYLYETKIITEAISRGEWFGYYGVGTHGFLFKLPVALVFLITGPSLSIATVWNVLLSCLSLFLFYKILIHYFKEGIYPFLGTLLLITNFQFILNLPTYMREIPVLVGLLLLIYVIIKEKPYWQIGLATLLVLEGKEYVLYALVPALLVYIFIREWRGVSYASIMHYFKVSLQVFLPMTIFLSLMVFTSVIPVNMYALSVLPGVTDGGMEYQANHFSIDMATTNRIEEDAPSLYGELGSGIEQVLNIVLRYVGKILYPRSFSFISIPKLIFFPALLTAILLFKQKLKKRDDFFLLFSLMFWSYSLIFLFRASFDRYLFPILPVVIFFFLLFIKELINHRKKFLWVTIIVSIIAMLGLFFEVDFIWIKVFLNSLIIFLYTVYFFYHKKFKEIYVGLILIISTFTFSVVAYFFYANGQLHQYLLWGRNFEIREVIKHFDSDEKVLLNDAGWDMLFLVYREDNLYDPEWKWQLQEWVPRKKDLRMFETFNSYEMYGIPLRYDVQRIKSRGIDTVALAVSIVEGQNFIYQQKLPLYMEADWLELREVLHLKGKEIYIFTVKEEYLEEQ